jgi:UV DNA damage endonuclease
MNDIQLGLCCINTELRKKNIFCSRKPILKTIKEKGESILIEKSKQNCEDLLTLIEWNHSNGIKVFRISSELFPHYSNPKSDVRYTLDFAQEYLTKAGELAKQYNQRLTFHPGQYNVLASPNENILKKTILDLDMHAEILDRMNCPLDSVMVIHAGGTYGDKEKTKARWIQRYNELPIKIKRRLVLENCEKNFSIVDCLDISSICGVPIVFDTHHYDCYKLLHRNEIFKEPQDYIPDILNTWKNIKPKFHVSQQDIHGHVGKHSDFIDTLPQYLLDIPKKYGVKIDIMIEAKKKEQAIFNLYKKYPELDLRL